jgi:hypothetical protein
VANTWERKTVQIAGNQTYAIPNLTNGVGIYFSFDLGSGTNAETTAGSWVIGDYNRTSACVKWANNASATLYLTGVQLEAGSIATPYELLQYEKQLELCQRYYARIVPQSGNYAGFGSGRTPTTSSAICVLRYPQTMRATPTLSQSSTAVYNNSAFRAVSSIGSVSYGDLTLAATLNAASTNSGSGATWAANNTTSAYVALDAEL